MAQVSWQGALSNTTKNYVLRSPEAFDAGRYIGEEPRGLFGTIIDNTAGGLEGMVGGAANALGTAGKALYQTGDASRAIGEAGKWLVDRSIDLGERAAANARRSGLRQEYADQGLVDRITNPSYWLDSRGFVADASNMVGSMIPFAVTSAVLPEVGVAGLVSGVLGRGAARVGANKLARSLLLDTAEERGAARAAIGEFTGWAPTGVLDAASNTGEVAETLRAQGYSDADILPRMGTSFLYEIPYDIGSQGLFGALISGKGLRSALKGESRARNVAVNAGLAGADALNEGFQEHVQTQANELALGKPVGTLWNQTPEEASAFASGAIGGAVPLFGSAARNVLSNYWNGSGEVEQPELQTSAQEESAPMQVKSSGNADIDSIIADAAAELNVPVNLIHAVAQTESGYNQDARSEVGAIGVMQLMPETAKGLGVDPTDLRGNIYGGAKYLRQLMDTFGGDMQKVIAAYNAGPGAVQKYGGIPPYEETQNYVQKVMGNLDGYDLGASGDVPVQVRSLADDAAPFIGVTMDNGTEGCVEAVTKIGANSSAFLAQELKNGVVNVDRLVEDAGDNVIAFDPNQLEEGDVIVYGDESDPQRHVVLYDGKGGYIGNSSSRNLVVHESDYNQMGDWHPTKIIKSGALFRGTSVRSISAPQMDFTGLVFDEKDIAATQKALNNLVHGGQPTPEQSAAILSAAEAIRDMPLGSVDKTAEAESYNEWQKLIDTKDIAGIVDKDPEGVARMVHQLAGAQKQQQMRAAIANQQQIEATKQAIAAVQQQRIEAAQARINNAVAQRNATVQDPQMQAEAPMQGAVQTPQIPMQTAPTNNIVGDTVVENVAPQTFSSPVEEAAKSLPVSREELSDILGKVQQWEQPLLSIPAYVQARDRQDWATAAQIAANAGQPGVAQFYNALMEHGSRNAQNVTPAPQENATTVTPYAPQENVVAAPPVQNASTPIPVVGVRPLVPDRLPDSTTGRRDLAHALGRFMVANNIPISKGLRDDLSIGYKKAILYADEKIRKWENERAGNAPQTAQDGAQSTEAQADDRMLAQRGERAQNGSKAVRGESAQKQAENEFPPGYRTESGRPISKADPKEFIIKPNGSRNFGEIPQEIEDATGGKVKSAPIRLRVGTEDGGFVHLVKEHAAQMKQKGYGVMDYINHILQNFNQVYSQQTEKRPHRFVLYCKGDESKGFMPIDLELEQTGENCYIIVSAMPHRPKINGTLLFDGSANPSAATTDDTLLEEINKNGGVDTSPNTHGKSKVPSVSTISPEEAESKENPLHEDEQTALKGLSADAKDVYRLVRDKLADSSNKKVARAASVGAVLLARHADIIARKIRTALGKPFTAMDYYRNMFALKTEGDKTGANVLHQAANAGGKMYAQSATNVPSTEKEAVRKQYEGTEQWMKAPNGEPTNLTEDQWVAVRTPAFKAWFGDWENDPENASKVVDENGEPMVVYHATREVFDTFRPSKSGWYGSGVYLTSDPNDTSYSMTEPDWHLMPLFAYIYNPLFAGERVSQEEIDAAKKEIADVYRSFKYDEENKAAGSVFSHLEGEEKRAAVIDFLVESLTFFGVEAGKTTRQQLENLMKDAYERAGAFYDSPHDGVIVPGNHGGTWFVARERYQVKSATKNNGAYDYGDVNIYHQKDSLDNDMADSDNESRISDAVFQKYLNDGIMEMVRDRVSAEIAEHVNLADMADPIKRDAARDRLPYIREMLVHYNDQLVQNNPAYKNRMAAKIEYARRCFDNDPRIQHGAVRPMDGHSGQRGVYEARQGTVSGSNGEASVRPVRRVARGVSRGISGERAGARAHFEKLYNDMQKHLESQGAFSIPKSFNQQINEIIKGTTQDIPNGQRIISLFEAADESTFLHEMGHLFLLDLEHLAPMSPTAEKDLATVKKWAAWREGQATEYKGTPFARSFAELDKKIRAALSAGNDRRADNLKRQWEHERFARGFEMYLKTGDAPTKGLRAVFAKFRAFLQRVYQAFTGTGGKATPEVEEVMARMIAMEEESIAENIERGKKAMQTVVATHQDVTNAMERPDVGVIDFVWGNAGKGAKFKKGNGIAHILAKHVPESGTQLLDRIVETIAKGEVVRERIAGEGADPRLILEHDGYVALLSTRGDRNSWLLSGWETYDSMKKRASSASGEGDGSTVATATAPMLSRRDGEDTLSSASNISPNEAESKQEPTIEELLQLAPALEKAALKYGAKSENGKVTFADAAQEKEFLKVAKALLSAGARKFSKAWTGSAADYDAPSLDYVGTGTGGAAYGYGLYYAEKRKMAEGYGDKLYHAEIPDADVLLDAGKSFDEQPPKVRKALEKLVRGLTLEQLENWNDVRRMGKAKVVAEIMDALSEADGTNIYGTISDLAEGQKEASELLNKYGVKGAVYNDEKNGRTFVVFDDKAIKILEKFSARRQEEIKKMLDGITLVSPNRLSPRKRALRDWGHEMGVPVVFFKGDPSLHGFHSDGVTFLNVDSEITPQWTFWHEAMHWMKANNPDLYNDIVHEISGAKGFTKEQLDAYRKEIGAEHMSDADVIEEMIADALPDVRRRVPLLRDVGKRDTGIVERLVAWVHDVMRRFHDHFFTPKGGLTNDQRRAMVRAFGKLVGSIRDADGKQIFRVANDGARITLRDGKPLPAVKYSLDNKAGAGDNGGGRNLGEARKEAICSNVLARMKARVQDMLKRGISWDEIHKEMDDENSTSREEALRVLKTQWNIFNSPRVNKRNIVERITKREGLTDKEVNDLFGHYKSIMKEMLDYGGFIYKEAALQQRGAREFLDGVHSWRSLERANREHGGSAYTGNEEKLNNNENRSDNQDGFSTPKFSARTNGESRVGNFRRMMDALKSGVKPSPRVEVHDGRREVTADIGVSQVKRFMKDKRLTDDEVISRRELPNGKVRITYYARSAMDIGYADQAKSVRQVAKRTPFVKALYDLASKAMHKQEKLRNDFAKSLKEFAELVKNPADMEKVTEILWTGDATGKEYTSAELRAAGASDNVVRAYTLVRRELKKAYELLNETRMQVKTRSKVLRPEDVESYMQSHWIRPSDVLSKTQTQDGNIELTWRGGKTYETKNKLMSAEELSLMEKDENINVTRTVPANAKAYGAGMYHVGYVERIKPINNLTGYMPHFFHEWMVYEQYKDPVSKEIRYTSVGSGRTLNEAVKIGNTIAEKNKDRNYVVRPKGFDMDAGNAVVVGDMEFAQMAKKLTESTQMSLADARTFLRESAGATLKSRHRFFGNMMKRKGAEGFDKNIMWVLAHYFNSSARYIAMEDFKPSAISFYERCFGAFDSEPKNMTARYCKDLINDVNGNPRGVEVWLNDLIKGTWLGKRIADSYGDRAALAVNGELSTWNAITKLGLLNFASAAVNFSQFINVGAALNDYGYAAKGLMRALHPSALDEKIIEASGLLEDINLAADNGGYSQRRGGRAGTVYQKAKQFGEWTLTPFQKADTLMRKAAVLGAYYQGVEKKGMEKAPGDELSAKAIAYAQQINDDANFDYSAANAPGMLRAGSVITQQLFQFQKYPIMQFEFMYNILKNGTRGQKVRMLVPYVLFCGIGGSIPFGELFNQLFSFLFGIATGDDEDIVIRISGMNTNLITFTMMKMTSILVM